jgi:hypothetical protein
MPYLDSTLIFYSLSEESIYLLIFCSEIKVGRVFSIS